MGKSFNGKIYPFLDMDFDGNLIIKYYDANDTLLGVRDMHDNFYPGPKYAYEGMDILEEIENSAIDFKPNLEEIDRRLEKVSRELDISKRDVLAMSQIDIDVAIKGKDIKDTSKPEDKKEKKIVIDEEEIQENEENREQNKDALENLNAKQEINLDKKIDDRYTLADVLDVPAGSKLLVVHSNMVQNGENTTRFSPLLELPDGTITRIDCLTQVGGKDSDKNNYEVNRDGSSVEKQNIKSSYAISSPIVQNSILNIRYGQMGNVEVAYGQMDKTSHHDTFTQRLETNELYPTTSRVREEFSKAKGEYNISEKIDEIKKHEEHDCNMTLEDADGDPLTGHDHIEKAVDRILGDEEVGKEIGDAFTDKEIEKRYNHMQQKFPNKEFDELVEITKSELATDAEFMHGLERK